VQALVIKQAQGLWVVETSAGVRWSGSSLESVLTKALGSVGFMTYEPVNRALTQLFNRIPDSGGGQIGSGVAGA
jgi:hypothetical protein